MSRRNKIALILVLIGIAVVATYDPITGALICVIGGMWAE